MKELILLFFSLPLISSSYLDYLHPYHPTSSDKGMVVSQNYLSSDIGAEILSKGGNAVDAAIAVGFSLTATLPRAGNIGGGGFMLIYNASKKTVISIDFRSMAPASASYDFYHKDGKRLPDISTGYKSIAVPGTVAGLLKAHDLFGSLTLAELIQPTLDLLEAGVPITEDLFFALGSEEQLQEDDESVSIYFNNGVVRGGLLRNPDLVLTLKRIIKNGAAGFYEGETADLFEKAMIANGGLIRKSDMARYKAQLSEPISVSYKGHTVYSQGPPSGGGVAILSSLKIFEQFNAEDFTPNKANFYHLLAEIMKFGHQNRTKFIGDPSFNEIPIEFLLSEKVAIQKSEKINLKRASKDQRISKWATDIEDQFLSKDTTHYSIVDNEGNAVATTYTLGYSFGSGVTIPGTGVLTNNQMYNFSMDYGLKDTIHLSGSPANKLEPFKRPMSSMAPVMIFDEEMRLKLITGSPGGGQIPDINLQVIINVIDYDLDIGLATMLPRIHHYFPGDELDYEATISSDTLRILKLYGHKTKLSDTIGSSQSILIKDKVNYGFADLRRPDAKVSIQQ